MSSQPCPQCGTPNPAGARFCRACGLSLTQRLHQSGALPMPSTPTHPPAATTPPASPLAPGPGAPTVAQGAGQPGGATQPMPPQAVLAQALAGQIGATPLAPGVTLQAGRYVIERALGAGGMGSVFLANDTHVNNKPVVIKEMASVYATEAERREAEAEFQAEMATLAALSHPNIPQISDFFTESNRHFAVQEYVGGQDLQKAVEAVQQPNQPSCGLPEKQTLAWISQVLAVLDYLEAQNTQVINRDIKPANIIVDAANRVRVVDFGIASHKFRPGSTRAVGAQVSTALGTPGYAPKEQFSGQETPLSDLYALGATMHHLLTGRDPTKTQPLWQYPPVRALNPKISERTERIVAKALQNEERKRYQSAAAMKRDVDRVVSPPSALRTVRGWAILLLVLLLLAAGSGGGVFIYTQLQAQQRPVGSLSAGRVAFDTDLAGLDALGVSASDAKAWAAAKVSASKAMANGDTQGALSDYHTALNLNPADAESAIYIEDQAVLAIDPHPYRIALGGSFSPAPKNAGDNVSVGRQNMQGAYTALKMINDAGGIHGHLLYLELANDASSTEGAQGAAQAVAKSADDILALIGFAFSSRTRAALPYIAQHGIPQLSPSASNPLLTGSPYFFRICPSDTQQGKDGADYLLKTVLAGQAHPVIAVLGDPSDAYAGGLQSIVYNELASQGARPARVSYTIGQANLLAQARQVRALHASGVYFAGYAREALLLSQAMDAVGVPGSVPIMSDDGFYDPQTFITLGNVKKGRFHFTSFFFPDEYNLLPEGPDRQRILAMEQAYAQNFRNLSIAAGGYGTTRVSADTALTFDAVQTLAYAIGALPANGVTRAGLQRALSGIGLNTPAYAGVTGHIRYAAAGQPATGDPIDKAIVVLHLDATLGRSHMDRFLGTY